MEFRSFLLVTIFASWVYAGARWDENFENLSKAWNAADVEHVILGKHYIVRGGSFPFVFVTCRRIKGPNSDCSLNWWFFNGLSETQTCKLYFNEKFLTQLKHIEIVQVHQLLNLPSFAVLIVNMKFKNFDAVDVMKVHTGSCRQEHTVFLTKANGRSITLIDAMIYEKGYRSSETDDTKISVNYDKRWLHDDKKFEFQVDKIEIDLSVDDRSLLHNLYIRGYDSEKGQYKVVRWDPEGKLDVLLSVDKPSIESMSEIIPPVFYSPFIDGFFIFCRVTSRTDNATATNCVIWDTTGEVARNDTFEIPGAVNLIGIGIVHTNLEVITRSMNCSGKECWNLSSTTVSYSMEHHVHVEDDKYKIQETKTTFHYFECSGDSKDMISFDNYQSGFAYFCINSDPDNEGKNLLHYARYGWKDLEPKQVIDVRKEYIKPPIKHVEL